MLNYGYHFARLDGGLRRKIYRRFLPRIVARTIRQPGSIPLDVFSFSGEEALPEQVRSIRSFLQHVGHPRSWTVVSDGSYTKRSIALLEEIDSDGDGSVRCNGPAIRSSEKGESLYFELSDGQTTRPYHVSAARRPGFISRRRHSLFSGRSGYHRNPGKRKLPHSISRIAWITR